MAFKVEKREEKKKLYSKKKKIQNSRIEISEESKELKYMHK